MFELLTIGAALWGVIAYITKDDRKEDHDNQNTNSINTNKENSNGGDNNYPTPRTW